MQKLSEKKIEIIQEKDQNVSGPLAPKKGFTLFGFFTSPWAETRGKTTATVSKEPALNNPHLNVPLANLTAVRNWVALEERIIHDYKEQKMVLPKMAAPLSKSPAKQPFPAFQTFTTQTAVSLPSSVPKLKGPLRGSKRVFSGLVVFFLVCGWLAAGAFIFLHVQETFLNRETSQKLLGLQSEKEQLGRSYAELKNASEKQGAEMKWLNSQLHDVTLELKMAKGDKVAYEKGLEKKYREELMRITVRYESEIAALRGMVQTQNAIVNALKAQGQTFDKIVDQVGMSALSGAAARLSRGPFSASGISGLRGVVTSVNGRQGSVVINLGSEQGALSERLITISRSGIGLAVGSIDRVYPTMSVAMVHDADKLLAIQAGDNVSFS